MKTKINRNSIVGSIIGLIISVPFILLADLAREYINNIWLFIPVLIFIYVNMISTIIIIATEIHNHGWLED